MLPEPAAPAFIFFIIGFHPIKKEELTPLSLSLGEKPNLGLRLWSPQRLRHTPRAGLGKAKLALRQWEH